MSTAAAEVMLQCLLGGTLLVHDMNIERRPYHKNCSCALHRKCKGEKEKAMCTAAAEMMLQCVYNGSLPAHDMDIERRPYRRNCSCALHKSRAHAPPHVHSTQMFLSLRNRSGVIVPCPKQLAESLLNLHILVTRQLGIERR
ncbi:hypothetical protein RJ639_040712 [Escallonia herrerae]|uniref:Uncharacterized protein n=1 Tax=Escallonia herrerae TaxID=1293975 RepID=A0AA88WDL5_9ASTE|nr:hypothetical protein RJ639_040712 [Escallonia herrerae]